MTTTEIIILASFGLVLLFKAVLIYLIAKPDKAPLATATAGNINVCINSIGGEADLGAELEKTLLKAIQESTIIN